MRLNFRTKFFSITLRKGSPPGIGRGNRHAEEHGDLFDDDRHHRRKSQLATRPSPAAIGGRGNVRRRRNAGDRNPGGIWRILDEGLRGWFSTGKNRGQY
jgi:hypothetical protein